MPFKKRQKSYSLLLIFVLLLSLLTPAVNPWTVSAEEEEDSIELKTISEIHVQDEEEVQTKGVVTAKLNNTLHIQDEDAAIAIHPVMTDVELGDEVTVTGDLSQSNRFLQLNNAQVEEKTSGGSIPEPLLLTGEQLKDHESELAVVENITLTGEDDGNNGVNFTAEDAEGNEFIVRDETHSLGLKNGTNYQRIIGIASQFNGEYQLIPRTDTAMIANQETEEAVQPVTASPKDGKVRAGQEVTLETPTPDAEIYYTLDDSEPNQASTLYESAITIKEDTTIKAVAYKEGLEGSDIATFIYTMDDSEDEPVVHDEEYESSAEDEGHKSSTADDEGHELSAANNEGHGDEGEKESAEIAQFDASEVDDSFNLSIMHMNDTHARVDELPKMITAINEYRLEQPDALLFHAGDVFSGTLYFNEFNGQADLAMLNLMDIDAQTFGNHEFDLGDKENGHKSLAKFVEKADFPFLGANIDFSKDPFMKDFETNQYNVENANNGEIYNSVIKEVEGESIGIFGLTTEDTVDVASPIDVEFEDFKGAAEEAVEEFEDAGINKIVAVTHLGYNSAPEVGNDERLAKEVDGIDVIVGGHSHTELSEPVVVDANEAGEETDPTVIVQAGQYAEYLGTVNVNFDDEGKVVGNSGELLEVAHYEADPEAVGVLAEYKEKVDEITNEEIGAEAMKDLTNPRQEVDGDGSDSVRANETELGNLVTDAMLAKTQEKYPETVIAVQNGGGIRSPIDEGPITTGEVINVLPFGNDPVIIDLSGEEIKEILEHSVRQVPQENGGFLHVSGMKFYFDSSKDPGDRVVDMYVNDDGGWTEIDLEETYPVTTNKFTGQGGDGFATFTKAFEEGRVKDTGEIDWEQLRDYMVEKTYLSGIVDPEREERIVDLQGGELPEKPGEPETPGDPEEEPGDAWLVGTGKLATDLGKEGNFYLNTNNGNVYQKTEDGWEWFANLMDDPTEEPSPWLEGKGKPAADLGQPGDLYHDQKADDVYRKTEDGWEKVGHLDSEEGGRVPAGNDGQKLPMTASHTPSLLLIGLIICLLGVRILLYQRKHRNA